MLTRLLLWLLALAPWLKKAIWRLIYEAAGQLEADRRRSFMNYGLYRDVPHDLPAEEEADRYPIQMYATVAAGDWSERDVVEVGCGRGGGLAWLTRHRQPRSALGLDLARSAVARCRREHDVPGLRFETGDAQALPLPDDSVDVVLNVESSHCYPDIDGFLAEVARVLRPGGVLLWADMGTSERLAQLAKALTASGLEQLEHETLTHDVIRALDAVHDETVTLVNARVPRPLRRLAMDLFATRGSRIYRNFEEGKWRYERRVLRRRSESGA